MRTCTVNGQGDAKFTISGVQVKMQAPEDIGSSREEQIERGDEKSTDINNVISHPEEGTASPNRMTPMSPPPRPDPDRVRPRSITGKSANRLSLSFPVQLPEPTASAKQSPTPSSPEVFSAVLSPRPDASATGSQDSNGFLVAIASQERRVLELKEELNRAEADLSKLKRQWAVHEAKRKRAEIKNVEKLRPLQIPQDTDPSSMDEDQSAVRKSLEMDRRRAILEGMAKDSRRKVFSGSHTRTLSLLSPDRSTYEQSPLPSASSDEASESNDPRIDDRISSKADTTSKLSEDSTPSKIRHSYQGGATGVKQLAEDLRAGIWTFMEDLRQATVGEEVVQRPGNDTGIKHTPQSGSRKPHKELNPDQIPHRKHIHPRKVAAGASVQGTAATPLAGGVGKVKGEGTTKGPQTPSTKQLQPETDGSNRVDEDWSSWESPDVKEESPRWSSSTTATSSSSSEKQARTTSPFNLSRSPFDYISVMGDGSIKTDESSWPALSNFAPGNLKRTATALMKEWERSLTPPPDPHKDNPFSSSSRKPMDEHEARVSLSNLP